MSEPPTPEEVNRLYDEVVGFLSSDDDDGYCPDKYAVANNPDLMKRDDMTRSLKALSRVLPLLSEEQKRILLKLAEKAEEDTMFYTSDSINLGSYDEGYLDPEVMYSIRLFYSNRFRSVWKLAEKIIDLREQDAC